MKTKFKAISHAEIALQEAKSAMPDYADRLAIKIDMFAKSNERYQIIVRNDEQQAIAEQIPSNKIIGWLNNYDVRQDVH